MQEFSVKVFNPTNIMALLVLWKGRGYDTFLLERQVMRLASILSAYKRCKNSRGKAFQLRTAHMIKHCYLGVGKK